MEKINFANSVARRIMVNGMLSFINQFNVFDTETNRERYVNLRGRKMKEENITICDATRIIKSTKPILLTTEELTDKIFKIAKPGKHLGFDSIIIEHPDSEKENEELIQGLISACSKYKSDFGVLDIDFGVGIKHQINKGCKNTFNIKFINSIHGFTAEIPVKWFLFGRYALPEIFTIETPNEDSMFIHHSLNGVYLFDREITVMKFTDNYYVTYDLYLCVDEELAGTDRDNVLLKLQNITNPDRITVLSFDHIDPINNNCWIKYGKLG